MKFVHEFDSSNWKTMHRLVAVKDDGTRIEGSFAMYEDFAFVGDEQVEKGITEFRDHDHRVPTSGYMVTTDYYEGTFPRVVYFTAIDVDMEEAEVSVISERFRETQAEEEDDAERIIAEAAEQCPCFRCRDERRAQEDEGQANDDTFAMRP